MRKGIGFFCLFTVLLTAAAFFGCQKKKADVSEGESTNAYGPPLTLTVGSSSAAEDLITQAMGEMKRLIEERSGGQITMNLYPASQLGASVEMMGMVSDGSMDMMIEANYLSQFGVERVAVASVPFSYSSREDYQRMVNSDFWKEAEADMLRLNGVRIIARNWFRPWAIIVSKKPIYRMEDLKGLKIRLPPVEMTIQGFQKLGVSPTPVAYNETLLALQQGVVDAAFIVEDAAYTMGWYEAAKYLIQSNQIIDTLLLYFSEKTYQSMTDAQRELLVQCATEAGDWYTAGSTASVERAYTAMKAAGVTVIPLDDAEWRRWQATVAPIGDEFEAAGRWEPGLYERMKKIIAGTGN
ncbi:MAG: TRAP transporter substrate-binding protein [Treponema sp.]|nr:TRAP transporter substrate-binding protein [Treponema sp.]